VWYYQSITRPKALQAFQRAAAELDQAFEGEVRDLTSTSQACATSAFRKALRTVRDTFEANGRLRHELAAAEASLEARREDLENEAWERVSQIQATHDVAHESIAERRCAAQQSLLEEQADGRATGTLAGVDGVLCAAVDCRKPLLIRRRRCVLSATLAAAHQCRGTVAALSIIADHASNEPLPRPCRPARTRTSVTGGCAACATRTMTTGARADCTQNAATSCSMQRGASRRRLKVKRRAWVCSSSRAWVLGIARSANRAQEASDT
jgi:hypothetical protein